MEFGSEIIKVLDYLGEKLGMTIDWSNKNVMPCVEQICGKYIKWEISTSIAWIVIALVSVVSLLIVTYVGYKKDWDGDLVYCLGLLSGIIGALAVCVIGVQIFEIIQCYVFPEKQIYEYISTLLKNS